MMYLGDYKEDATVYFGWGTNDKNGASITRSTDGDIIIYKDDDVGGTQAGVTDVEDWNSKTGIHNCKIDLNASSFYESGHDYSVILSGAVIDGETVNAVLATFSIENRFAGSSVFKKAAKLLVNKAVQNKATGTIDYYDDDGATVILTHTPADTESSITRTPS